MQVFSHKKLSSILEAGLSLYLVEASPALSTIQEATLQDKTYCIGHFSVESVDDEMVMSSSSQL